MKVCPYCQNQCNDNDAYCSRCSFNFLNAQNYTTSNSYSDIPYYNAQQQQGYAQYYNYSPALTTYYYPPKPSKKSLPGWAIAVIIVSSILIILFTVILPIVVPLFIAFNEETEQPYSNEYEYNYNDSTISTDRPFYYDDMNITVQSNYTVLDSNNNNISSDKVICITININNTSSSAKQIDASCIEVLPPRGNTLEILNSYYQDGNNLFYEISPGQTVTAHLYVGYKGKGDYFIYFSDFQEDNVYNVEVPLTITK